MIFSLNVRKSLAYIPKTLAIFLLTAIPSLLSAAPPAEFSVQTLVSSGLDVPTGFAIAPDGRIFIVEQQGRIKIFKNGELLTRDFDELPAFANGDRGLLGIVFDPNFSTNHFVYFYYAGTDLFNYVVRFDASTDIAQNGPVEIYHTHEPSGVMHAGGTIAFGPDGKLYLGLGDNANPANAQNLNVPFGKIVRFNSDGSIPADNPFVGQAGKLPEIWAYGLRNPFRFQFDPANGKQIVGDVGQDTWEEVNIIEKGKNYGWPNAEGSCSGCPSENPIYQYAHSGQGASITGGPVYRSTLFPAAYQGKYFFADFVRGFIKTIDPYAANPVAADFDTGAGAVIDMKVGPDGALYYLTIFPGRLYRVAPVTDDEFPVAIAGSNLVSGPAPLSVQFSSTGSNDPEGESLTYAWDFGDGTTSVEASPMKTFAAAGRYTVALTVSDGVHTSTAIPIEIQAGTPPTVEIVSPDPDDQYEGGELFNYEIDAIDSDGQALDDDQVSTEITFHHNTHMHPFIRPQTGKTGEFTIPSEGETATDVYYMIRTTATDGDGLRTTATQRIDPKIVDVRVTTVPSALSFELDGATVTSPRTFASVAGMKRRVGIADQSGYEFDRWSDGKPRQHAISPLADLNLTATLIPGTPFSAEYFANASLSGAPVLTRLDPSIAFDWGGDSPAPGTVPNDNFSARWTKRTNFAAGEYEFHMTTDDGGRLFVDNVLIIDKWINQAPTEYHATRTLTVGEHEIRMEYYDAGGGAVARLSWDALSIDPTPDPEPGPPEDVYAAKYYANRDLAGLPAVSRTDAVLDFDWALGAPAVSLPNDNFSAEWLRTLHLEAGEYDFTVEADDGVRLFIDDALVIDKWIDQPATRYVIRRAMTDGHHVVKIQYYERGGNAVAKFSYEPVVPVPPPTGVWMANYYAGTALAGAPLLTQGVAAIDFDWAFGSPDPLVPSDNFSARFTRTISSSGGPYHLSLAGDDGVRVRIDGAIVLDGWRDQATTSYETDVTLAPGSHDIAVEYYERGGHAVLSFDLVSQNSDYAAEYWSLPGFTGTPSIPNRAADVTRTDSAIDFDWGTGIPAPGISADFFVGRWMKRFSAVAGSYDVSLTADDGVRVYIDDALVLDKWIDQPPTTYAFPIALTAGPHDLRIEYYEKQHGAVMRFSLTPQSGSRPVTARYFANTTLSGSPVLVVNEAVAGKDWGSSSPHPSVPADRFSAEYTWEEVLAAGTYDLTLVSDDGVRFYIDDVLVHDDWTLHAPKTSTFFRTLTAGTHRYRLEYFENEGGAILQFTQVLQ